MTRAPVVLTAEDYRRAAEALKLSDDDGWRRSGLVACRAPDVDPDFWFAESEPARIRASMEYTARKTCQGCAVRLPCLAYGLRVREPFGIWGGYDPDELSRLRGALRVQAASPVYVNVVAAPYDPVDEEDDDEEGYG